MKISNNIHGTVCSLRNSHLTDCKDMLVLRNDPHLSKFLKKVENDINKQKIWLKKQRELKNKICLTIIDNQNRLLGYFTSFTIFNNDKFDPGGWIMHPNTLASMKICALVLAYEIGFNNFNLPKAYLRIRKGNLNIMKMHFRMGAIEIDNDKDFNYLILSKKTHNKSSIRKLFINV
tara:strand:- start:49 stop:576 length:528 start_codon:yes stop_codon:yes gene_type:complete